MLIFYGVLFVVGMMSIPLFFATAKRLRLYDKPNERSSHTTNIYRGAGLILLVVFTISGVIGVVGDYYLLLGAGLGALVGFWDDLSDVKAIYRAFAYGIAIILCLYPLLQEMNNVLLWILLILILGVGFINAFNFMDGINGMSILYTLVFILSMHLAIAQIGMTIDANALNVVLISLFPLTLLNLRNRAMAFLGDVGSVFLGILLSYWTFTICYHTNSILFLGFLMLYGIDTVITIIERLIKGENIFNAHRTHLYQLLANELKWPHLLVSTIYALIQLMLNILIIWVFNEQMMIGWQFFSLLSICLISIYLFIKSQVRKSASTLNM